MTVVSFDFLTTVWNSKAATTHQTTKGAVKAGPKVIHLKCGEGQCGSKPKLPPSVSLSNGLNLISRKCRKAGSLTQWVKN